jgi:hypothetical protein
MCPPGGPGPLKAARDDWKAIPDAAAAPERRGGLFDRVAAPPRAGPYVIPAAAGVCGAPHAAFACNACGDDSREPVVPACGHICCWPCLYG